MINIFNYKNGLNKIANRTQLNFDNVNKTVENIVNAVKENGEKALLECRAKYDNITESESLIVSEQEIDKAFSEIDSDMMSTLIKCRDNILEYHNRQRKQSEIMESKGGSKVGWLIRPVKRAGIYVPGGKAAYPSTVLMAVLPAVAAGVQEIYVTTPNPMPLLLVACRLCGVTAVYRMGGAHAVSAMAYGTDTVKAVDVIAGPGNIYVTVAKKLVYGVVNIDMLAGPSEIAILCDDTANVRYISADLLSQAEHDELAASILVTTSKKIAEEVQVELHKQLSKLERNSIADKSIDNYGAIILVDNMEQGIEIINTIAPEHLEIIAQDYTDIVPKIANAGAIFVGNYSPEPLGDYFAGPSHTLPTGGTARYFSVLSVDTFVKRMSYIEYTKDELLASANDIIRLAQAEGLTAHANSIIMRMEDTNEN